MASDAAQYDKGGNSIQLSSFSGAAGPARGAPSSPRPARRSAPTPSPPPPTARARAPSATPAGRAADIHTTRPTVAITSPANGAMVGGTVPITVNAADDAAEPTRVEFVVDGAPVAMFTAAPWSDKLGDAAPSAPGPHTITVTAYDAADNVATARADVTAGTDTGAPAAPGGVTAQATSATSATVSWAAATDDVGVTGYRVLRDGVQVGTTTTALTFTDSAVTSGRTYAYTVTASDAARQRLAPVEQRGRHHARCADDRLRGGVGHGRRTDDARLRRRRTGRAVRRGRPAGRAQAGSPTASPSRSARPTCSPSG